MPEAPHNPQIHNPAGKSARSAQIAEAGKAAAARVSATASPEAAVQAAVSVAAERAAERDAGRPSELARPEPVAQHTDAAAETDADVSRETVDEPAPEAAAKVDLSVRLKRKQREAQQKLSREQQDFAKRQADFAARETAAKEFADRSARLDKLRVENPAQWLEEVGMTPEIHKAYIKAKLAEGKPEGLALKAETEAQKVARELAELKATMQQEKQNVEAHQIRQAFVATAKAEDYPVLHSLYGDDPGALVDLGENWAQPRFRATHNRFGTHEELLFNLECIKAGEVARATGNEKLSKAVQRARETTDLKHIREALGKLKPADKEKAKTKSPPGPAAQSRTSAPSGDTRSMTQKERRAKAAEAGRMAQEKVSRGETQFDPSYLAGSK